MDSFFSAFQGFTRNPGESPEKGFRRLQESQGWSESDYLTLRLRFFEALIEETNSPIHRFFITQNPEFLTYDSDVPPRLEFERLGIFKNWMGGDVGEDSRVLFERAVEEEDSMHVMNSPQSSSSSPSAFQEEFSSPLDNYYLEYTDFPYNPQNPPMVEFKRLMRHKGWGPRNRMYKEARGRFFEAFMEDFNTHFGTDEENITTWQHLCEVLGVDPIPETITKCRKILQQFNVNIYDLLQHKRTGAAFEFFESVGELRKYTKKHGLVFPRASAKGGPLRFLLREIFSPRGRRGVAS